MEGCGVEIFSGPVQCPVVVLKFSHKGRPRSSNKLVLLHDLYHRFCEAQSRTEPVVPKIFTYLRIDIPLVKVASGTFRPDLTRHLFYYIANGGVLYPFQ
jgi:hypothetical protein